MESMLSGFDLPFVSPRGIVDRLRCGRSPICVKKGCPAVLQEPQQLLGAKMRLKSVRAKLQVEYDKAETGKKSFDKN